MAYGGGFIKKNGVYDQVKKDLNGYNAVEFSGVEPNPKYKTCMKAAEIIKNGKIDFYIIRRRRIDSGRRRLAAFDIVLAC